MSKSKDCVVWCKLKGKDEEQRPFEVDGKEIFSNGSKQANPKAGEKTEKKGGKGQSVRWTGKHQMHGDRRVCLVLGSPRLPCGRCAKSSAEESDRSVRRKMMMIAFITFKSSLVPLLEGL